MSFALCGRIDLGRFTLDIDIEAERGDVVALIGPNGCGKTTALLAAAGLLGLSSGVARIGGVVVDEPETRRWVPAHKRHVGFVFQGLELFPHMSVRDNVAYGLRRRGCSRRIARERASTWLDIVGIGELSTARPTTLSGGQAQRVALARALVLEPDVLLLDEALSALDAESSMTMRGELRRYLDGFAGVTLMATHDVLDVVALADRVVVLDSGRVTQDATPSELWHHPRTSHAAAFVSKNLFHGVRHGTLLDLGEGITLTTTSSGYGAVDVICSPRAVHVSPRHEPRPDEAWESTVRGVEAVGDHARVNLGAPIPIRSRITLEQLAGGLQRDAAVWVRLDPELLDFIPRERPPACRPAHPRDRAAELAAQAIDRN